MKSVEHPLVINAERDLPQLGVKNVFDAISLAAQEPVPEGAVHIPEDSIREMNGQISDHFQVVPTAITMSIDSCRGAGDSVRLSVARREASTPTYGAETIVKHIDVVRTSICSNGDVDVYNICSFFEYSDGTTEPDIRLDSDRADRLMLTAEAHNLFELYATSRL